MLTILDKVMPLYFILGIREIRQDGKKFSRFINTDALTNAWQSVTQESLLHPDIADISFIPKGFFNWTLTFKRASDFPLPYGHFFPLQLPAASTSNDTNYAEGKDKLVAWAVSNCGPQTRGIYVKELLKHIQVDVYGKCGSVYGQNNKCSRGSQECVELFKTYKF